MSEFRRRLFQAYNLIRKPLVSINDKLILNCSSVKFSIENITDIPVGYYLWFYIKAIGKTIITFNDFRLELQAGESQTVKIFDGTTEQQTGDLIIDGKCEFSTTTIRYQMGAGYSYFKPFLLNEIKQWDTTLDYIPDYFLEYCQLNSDMDVYIPNNIKKIGYGSFGDFVAGSSGAIDYTPFKNSNIYLPSSLEEYYFNSFGLINPPLNFINDGIMIYADNCLICRVSGWPSATNYVVDSKTRLLPNGYETTSTPNDNRLIWRGITNIDLSQATLIKKIPKYCFAHSSNTSISIPSSVNEIGDSAFYNTTISSISFYMPSGANITLGTQLFYHKTATNITIYTDNETIKNYDYATDNVTPTFYHLDGTLWE